MLLNLQFMKNIGGFLRGIYEDFEYIGTETK